MARWAESADLTQRRDVLDSLLGAVQRYGSAPAKEHHMLIEILGVHTALVMTSQLLSTHVKDCARMSLENKLPHTHWTHVVRAVDAIATEVPFDQVGNHTRKHFVTAPLRFLLLAKILLGTTLYEIYELLFRVRCSLWPFHTYTFLARVV